MLGDRENYHDEEETMDVLKRYQEFLIHRGNTFFDLSEYECIIDYFIEQFKYKDAIGAADMAIRQHPYSSSLKLKYVQLLIETGKPAKALGIIRSIDGAESTNYELFLAKGIALNLTGKHTQAQTFFERAIKLCDDARDEVTYNIAQSYMQIGMLAKAVKYLLLAYHHNEDNILVLYDLAVTFEKLNYPEKSIFYYNKYLDLDPYSEHVWNNLGQVYARNNDPEKAIDAYDMAIAINPVFHRAHFNKAEVLETNNDFRGAIDVYSEVLIHDHANTRALCSLGDCYEETGRFNESLKFYRQALMISRDCHDAWYGIGLIYYRQKRFRLSISFFRKALGIRPDNADCWFMLGQVYADMNKLDDAIFAYSRVSEINPTDTEAWMACAQAYFRKKRIDEAIRIMLQVYQYHHENPKVNYRLAAYYIYKDDKNTALTYFKKALSLNYRDNKDMFRTFPKTRTCIDFLRLVNRHIHDT